MFHLSAAASSHAARCHGIVTREQLLDDGATDQELAVDFDSVISELAELHHLAAHRHAA